MARKRRPRRGKTWQKQGKSEPIQGELTPAPSSPLQSDILQDPARLSSDCRMVRGLIKLGVVTQEKADALLSRIYDRALDKDVNTRDLKNLASLIKDFAKLQIDLDKQDKPVRHQHAHLHAHGTIDDERSRMAEIAARAGVPDLYQ